MGINKKKISELPLADSLIGLYTIGVDALNRSVKVGLEFLKTAADSANDAAQEAITAIKDALSATDGANTAANNANAKAALADSKATLANDAATLANSKVQEANTTIIRLEQLEQSLVGQYKMIPTGLKVQYPERITLRNTVPKVIKYEVLPTDTGRNVLFLGDNGAVEVMPNGEFTPKRAGISTIHVIPTENTNLYKTIQITVVEPELRKVKNALRIMSNGSLRLT